MALVRLSSPPETVWTGVVISENGEILTTSQTLGEAPVVDIRLWDGTQVQACVTGRDDDIGLALLDPLIERPGAYDYLTLSGESPSTGQELILLQHASFSPALDGRFTMVMEREFPYNGDGYVRIRVADSATADGAVLADASGGMVGMRMPPLWLLQNQIASPGEVVAVDAPAIARFALPTLRSGRIHVQPVLSRPDVDTVPWLPVILHGEITLDDAPAPVGTLLHAKVSKEGEPDYWQSTPLEVAGEYVFPLSTETGNYFGGTVEFWVDCKRLPMAVAYEVPSDSVSPVELDLAF